MKKKQFILLTYLFNIKNPQIIFVIKLLEQVKKVYTHTALLKTDTTSAIYKLIISRKLRAKTHTNIYSRHELNIGTQYMNVNKITDMFNVANIKWYEAVSTNDQRHYVLQIYLNDTKYISQHQQKTMLLIDLSLAIKTLLLRVLTAFNGKKERIAIESALSLTDKTTWNALRNRLVYNALDKIQTIDSQHDVVVERILKNYDEQIEKSNWFVVYTSTNEKALLEKVIINFNVSEDEKQIPKDKRVANAPQQDLTSYSYLLTAVPSTLVENVMPVLNKNEKTPPESKTTQETQKNTQNENAQTE